MELDLAGRRALITGGSKGIGLGDRRGARRRGRRRGLLRAERREVERSGLGELRAHGADRARSDRRRHRRPSRSSDLVDETRPLRSAASTSSSTTPAPPIRATSRSLSDEDWRADLDVKLFSQIRCTRAALPHLRASAAPRVININSVYARYPDPDFFATTVNRAACLNLSKALARELAAEGILVNSVNIGFVVTPQWENIRRRRAPELHAQRSSSPNLARDEVPLGTVRDRR